MNSIFLRLYLLIVATVLVVGISLDYLWQNIDNKEEPTEHYQSLLRIVSLQIDNLKIDKIDDHLSKINQSFNNEFSLLSSKNHLARTIEQEWPDNETLFVQSDSEILGFIRLVNHQKILQLKISRDNQASFTKSLFILLFYSLIAIVIFYWIWPLSKDLSRLENAVKQFDHQQWQSKVELPPTSSISHLANAYNALLDKIKFLVETQQAMSHSISHELRTPLARVRFSLQMAEESEDITETRKQITSISDDVSEMNDLINELLNFASLERVATVAKMEKGDFATLVETLIERLTKNIQNKHIEFIKLSDDKHVSCDSYLMERAMQNLILNACKFSDKNILITFQQNTDFYELIVEDDGPGIPEESHEKIFDSFVQLKHQHKNKGFGLGLTIVKRVMTLHAGHVMVEKSSLGGVKFILSWPR